MRSRPWPHALVVALVPLAAWRIAAGQAADPANPLPPPPKVKVQPVTPAGSASDSDLIPDDAAGPPKFAVTPFENHVVRGSSLDWIIAEAPFEIAEKTEVVLGLEPINPPAYVPGERVPAEPDTVAAYGQKVGAAYVVTGWFDRPGQDLRVDVVVWKLDGKTAKIAGEAQRMGAPAAYHKLLGEAMGDAWTKSGATSVDLARGAKLSRPLANDMYAVTLVGKGLGQLTGAIAAMSEDTGSGATAVNKGPDLKAAEASLERAVFVDPKMAEAQRLLGELYMIQAALPGPGTGNATDARLVARAAGKFNYAADLAPDDLASLRAAAYSTAAAGKWEVALDMFRRLVTKKPWDLEARYQLGAAMWQVGDAHGAEKQLQQVTARQPDHLPARRVLVLIHASRSDTPKLIGELEEIAARAPGDLDVKADLATAYGAIGQWPKAIERLEQIAGERPSDMPLHVRIGDAHRKNGDLSGALEWYGKAQKMAPESSLPGFAIAQSLYDAGQLDSAARIYIGLQRYWQDLPAAEEALGAIAMLQNKANEAAWYLRKATRETPRSLPTRRAVIAAELMRKDPIAALQQLDPALAAWPDDGVLHYLAGVAHQLEGDPGAARAELGKALEVQPGLPAARAALAQLGAGGAIALDFKPELVRPWGDADAVQDALDRFAAISSQMTSIRDEYQGYLLGMLGVLGVGPLAEPKPPGKGQRVCPVGRIAKPWAAAQATMKRYQKLGLDLESTYRFIARHDEAGLTASLLPNGRTAVAGAKKAYRTALADAGELRSEWTRGLGMELRVAGCTDRLLAAAVADPARYKIIEEDQPDPIPEKQGLRAKPRTTFFVDNTRCTDPVTVWIDGSQIGEVAPGRRSALVADGGERTLCLLGPGSAQCGDRGTVRQVYLHDGWSVTMYCPK
jgi:tetratricopeptide (TPR) repeat protein